MNSGPTLRKGSKGADVRRLQRILVMIKDLEPAGIDGAFGARTDLAVRNFQESEGLAIDGIVGRATWAALPADPNTPTVSRGDRGPVVSALQVALRKLHGPGAPTDPGAVDGEFGRRTEAAVRAYQAERKLKVDGKVSDRTWWAPAGAAGATLASLAGLTTV